MHTTEGFWVATALETGKFLGILSFGEARGLPRLKLQDTLYSKSLAKRCPCVAGSGRGCCPDHPLCPPGKIDMVKSKWGLALAAVVTVLSSLLMSVGLCTLFGLTPTLNGG